MYYVLPFAVNISYLMNSYIITTTSNSTDVPISIGINSKTYYLIDIQIAVHVCNKSE